MKAEYLENLEFFYDHILDLPNLPDTKVILVDKDLTNINLLKRNITDKIKQEKYNKLKPVLDEISKLFFLSGKN